MPRYCLTGGVSHRAGFLLAIAYPQTHEPSTHNTQEESLLAFYAFRRIWDGKMA